MYNYAIVKFYKCEIACKTVCKILIARAGAGTGVHAGMCAAGVQAMWYLPMH
jgi:hypothetical protein